jgi:tripartite-type tricarboxylate transporter receptor subunit TctC
VKLPHRRQFLHLAAGAVTLPVVSRAAGAQAYPTRPVRIIVRFPAGGTDDTFARLIGQWLSEQLGQPYLVRTVQALAATSPRKRWCGRHGHTLLLVSPANAINATLYAAITPASCPRT